MKVSKMLLGKVNGSPVAIVPADAVLVEDVMKVRIDAHIASTNDKTETTQIAVIPWGDWLQAQMYMQHLRTCASKNRKPCDCGLDKLMEEA